MISHAKAYVEKVLAVARFIFVAMIVLAVGMAGIGHTAAYEGGNTAISVDGSDIDAHSAHSTEGGVASDTSDAGDCSDVGPCVGCATHCSAMAVFDPLSKTTSFGPERLLVMPHEQLLASDTATLERPPRTI